MISVEHIDRDPPAGLDRLRYFLVQSGTRIATNVAPARMRVPAAVPMSASVAQSVTTSARMWPSLPARYAMGTFVAT